MNKQKLQSSGSSSFSINPELVFKQNNRRFDYYHPKQKLLDITKIFLTISLLLPMPVSLIKHQQLSRDVKGYIYKYKDKISLKREAKVKTQYFNNSYLKLMKLRSFLELFNVITMVITPSTDKEYLFKLSTYYNQFNNSKMRFCLDMFDVDDNKQEHLDIFDYVKPLPQVTSVKMKNCQFITKKVFYMVFWKCKMIYILDSQFKFWTWKPLHAEQFIVKKSTIWGRANIAQGMLGKCKRFEFVQSATNYLDLLLKPFSNSNLREYVIKQSQVHRRGILDPLYSVSWFQTRHRFKHLTLIDIEGVISEANLISLIVYMDYFKSLQLVKMDVDAHNSFDMRFVLEHSGVQQSGVFKDYKIVQDGRIRKFVSQGRFKNEGLMRKFDIKYLAKEEGLEYHQLNGQSAVPVNPLSFTEVYTHTRSNMNQEVATQFTYL